MAYTDGVQVALSEKLVTTKQRENAGANSLDRYDFQAVWGLNHLLDLHETDSDYAIAFEFHDDILVIDSVTSPTHVRFFQVKTLDAGLWSLKKLMERKKGNSGKLKPSIIGKLLANKQKFPNETDYLGFVSNQPADFISVVYPCGFSQAPKTEFKNFLIFLRAEFPSATEDDANLFHYHRSNFSLESYRDGIRGRLASFILENCGKFELGQETLLLMLLDYCRERSKHIEHFNTFSDLLEAKFLTRAEIDKLLEEFKDVNRRRPPWDTAHIQMHGGYGLAQLRNIQRCWQEYGTDLFVVNDFALRDVRDQARKAIAAFLEANQDANFIDMLETVLAQIMVLAGEKLPHRDDDYLRALIAWEYNCP